MRTERESNGIPVKLCKYFNKSIQAFSCIVLVGEKYTVKRLLAFKRNPCKLATVVVKKTRSKAYSFACRNVGQGGIMIRAVEVFNLPG